MGETVRTGSAWKWLGESTNLGMPFCASRARSTPVRVRARHQNGWTTSNWEEKQSGTHVELIETR